MTTIFGKSEIGSNSDLVVQTDNSIACRYRCLKDIGVTKPYVYLPVAYVLGFAYLRFGIYDDNGGTPENLINQGVTEPYIEAPCVVGSYLQNGIDWHKNEYYWLAAQVHGYAKLYYDAGLSDQTIRCEHDFWYNGFNNPWDESHGSSHFSYELTFYIGAKLPLKMESEWSKRKIEEVA